MISEKIRPLLFFTAGLLCFMSLAASVLLWVSIPVTWWGQVMAGIAALGLELAKFAFVPVGFWLLVGGRFWLGGLSLVTGLVLLVVSVAASVGFLELASRTGQAEALRSDVVYQSKVDRLADLSARIRVVDGLVAADARADFRGRALGGSVSSNQMDQERKQLEDELVAFEPVAQSSLGALVAGLAGVLGVAADSVRAGLFWMLAWLVEVAAVVSLLLLGMEWRPGRDAGVRLEAPPEPEPLKNAVVSVSVDPVLERVKPVIRPREAGDPVVGLANRIRSGEFGDRPALRRVRSLPNVSQRVAREAFDRLVAQGYLVKDRQGFRVA